MMKQEMGEYRDCVPTHRPVLVGRLQQVGNFRIAKHLNPVRVEMFRVAGKGQARLLDA